LVWSVFPLSAGAFDRKGLWPAASRWA
jgi:hypothetical protein